LGDLAATYADDKLHLAPGALVELVPAFLQLGKHRTPHRSAPHRATHDANVRVVGPTTRADRPDLDLHAGHRLRHCDDQRTHISADIEDDRALSGVRILWMHVHGGGGHGDVVPGIVW
jgi:hypothetical protein